MATAMTKPGTHPAALAQHSDGFFCLQDQK